MKRTMNLLLSSTVLLGCLISVTATHTWYGLFCSGRRTESIDVMQRFWSGAWPKNRAPAIQGLGIDGFADPRSVSLQAGKVYRAETRVTDPDADRLVFAWDIRPEVEIPVRTLGACYSDGLLPTLEMRSPQPLFIEPLCR